MVGIGILQNNIRPHSPEGYTIFWRMTIYSDTLHWVITHFFDPLLIWTLLLNLTFYLIVWRFHRTFATGSACQQRTLTPPNTWSCPTLGLACVLMSRPISPELVLFPDFWVSNIPRYFCCADQNDHMMHLITCWNMVYCITLWYRLLDHKLLEHVTYIQPFPCSSQLDWSNTNEIKHDIYPWL